MKKIVLESRGREINVSTLEEIHDVSGIVHQLILPALKNAGYDTEEVLDELQKYYERYRPIEDMSCDCGKEATIYKCAACYENNLTEVVRQNVQSIKKELQKFVPDKEGSFGYILESVGKRMEDLGLLRVAYNNLQKDYRILEDANKRLLKDCEWMAGQITKDNNIDWYGTAVAYAIPGELKVEEVTSQFICPNCGDRVIYNRSTKIWTCGCSKHEESVTPTIPVQSVPRKPSYGCSKHRDCVNADSGVCNTFCRTHGWKYYISVPKPEPIPEPAAPPPEEIWGSNGPQPVGMWSTSELGGDMDIPSMSCIGCGHEMNPIFDFNGNHNGEYNCPECEYRTDCDCFDCRNIRKKTKRTKRDGSSKPTVRKEQFHLPEDLKQKNFEKCSKLLEEIEKRHGEGKWSPRENRNSEYVYCSNINKYYSDVDCKQSCRGCPIGRKDTEWALQHGLYFCPDCGSFYTHPFPMGCCPGCGVHNNSDGHEYCGTHWDMGRPQDGFEAGEDDNNIYDEKGKRIGNYREKAREEKRRSL